MKKTVFFILFVINAVLSYLLFSVESRSIQRAQNFKHLTGLLFLLFFFALAILFYILYAQAKGEAEKSKEVACKTLNKLRCLLLQCIGFYGIYSATQTVFKLWDYIEYYDVYAEYLAKPYELFLSVFLFFVAVLVLLVVAYFTTSYFIKKWKQ